MGMLDHLFEAATRRLAMRSSRRGALARLGRALVGGALLAPVLPVDRSASFAQAQQRRRAATETSCDYWKYCSVDGFLCSCCGGSSTECPPGTEMSTVSWVGTCRNPGDGKDYMVSYNDCCGNTTCGRCLCNMNVRERPGYQMGLHNDVNWCMGNENSTMYHCTVSVIIGRA